MEFLDIEKKDRVAVIKWRHEEQNRFHTPFLEENLTILDELANDDKTCGVVVTSATEKFFSTGLYLEWMMEQGGKNPENLRAFLELIHKFLIVITGYPKPLIAAINGHAAGAGAIVAACMDFRFMREEKGFVRLPEIHINIPFWPGMTAIFKDIMPARHIRDLFYLGEKHTALEMAKMGYVDFVCPYDKLVPKAVEMAAKLGIAESKTYAIIKRGLRQRVLEIMEKEDSQAIEDFMANALGK